MLQITETGLVIERLNEIYARLVTSFKGIYGQDINLEPDTPDGQMVGIFSQSLADINEVIAVVFQMLDPYQATGAWLEQRALYAGIVRRGAEYSYINNVVVLGTRLTSIAKGAVLVDANRVRWVTLSDITLDGNGSAQVNLRSESLGAFSLGADQQLTFETIYAGVDRATTTEAAKEGAEEETDPDFLHRFMMSHAINNEDDREGIQAALLNVADVRKVLVLENETGQMDADTGVPAHSVNAIVVGGTDEDIALTLLKKKKGGGAFFGDQSVQLVYKELPRTARFDRATPVSVTVSLTYRRLKNLTDLNETDVKDSLLNRDFAIAEDVYAMKLICGINSQENFNLETLTVNDASFVSIGWREYAVIEKVEIIIV